MKILHFVLIAVFLLVSCTTVEEIESLEDLEEDEVKGSEVTQEEFEELFEEPILIEETPFVFPIKKGKKEWVSVPGIETIVMVESVDSLLLDEDVSVVPEAPTLFLLSQSTEDDKASEDRIIAIKIQEEVTESEIEVNEMELAEIDEYKEE